MKIKEDEGETKREEYEKFQIILSKKKTSQKRLDTVEEKKSSAIIELNKYVELKNKGTILEQQLGSIMDLSIELATLEGIQKEYNFIKNSIGRLKEQKKKDESWITEQLQKKVEQFKKTSKRVSDLKTEIDHFTAFKLLNQEGRLLERIQRISLEQTWRLPQKLIDELKIEQEQTRNELMEVLDKKSLINVDSFKLTEIQTQMNELEEEIKSLESRLTRITETTDKVLYEEELKLEHLGFTEVNQKRLQDLQAKTKTNQKLQDDYNRWKEEFKAKIDPTSKIETYKSQIKDITKENSEYDSELENYEQFRKDYEHLQKTIDQKKKELQDTKELMARIDQTIKNTQDNIVELKVLRPKVKTLQDQLKELVKEEEILLKLKNEIFHVRGTPFYAIKKILPRLGKRASYNLAEITDQRLTSVQLQRVEKKRQGLGFEINIRTPQGTRDISTFSGGEKTQINAALRIAISEELSALGSDQTAEIGAKKTLFIDEGDLGSLDTISAQQAFVKKLFQLSNKFKIILITHITEIADQFPHSIQITNNESGRSIKGE